jgi:periplasmic protein TonB
MSATTVNAFPPLHAFSSSRSWFIALIVLVHVGFFWALTHHVVVWPVAGHAPFTVIDVPIDIVDPQPPALPEPTDFRTSNVDPLPMPNEIDYLDDEPVRNAPQVPFRSEQPPVDLTEHGPGSGPIIVAPRTDPRYPLTEPDYPAMETRLGHEGTVLLQVQILPNGRVGDVKLERSSGFVRLDESAMREAKTWRMKPGTQDGVASAMWTIVPITFQLKD